MRLALVGPVYPYRGGIAHYTTMLCEALRTRGHAVLMVSFKRQYPRWLFPGKSDRDPSAWQVRVQDARYWIDSLNPLTWLQAWLRIRRERPEAMVLQWWTPWWAPTWFVLGALNRLSWRRPIFFVCHNVLPHEPRRWDRAVARSVLGWGSQFIVQSTEEKARLLDLLPGAEVTVFPLPVLDLFAGRRPDRGQARAHLGIDDDLPVLLFFGIVREYKGLRDLLAALPGIQSRLGRIQLLVAGEFWEDEGMYRAEMERLGIEDLVRIDNRYIPNEEACLYFAAADLLVAPYRRVTGSAVVRVARAFGLPVLATSVGGLAAAVAGGPPPVPPADPRALEDTIVAYLQDRMRQGRPAPTEPAQDPFSWPALIATLERMAGEAER